MKPTHTHTSSVYSFIYTELFWYRNTRGSIKSTVSRGRGPESLLAMRQNHLVILKGICSLCVPFAKSKLANSASVKNLIRGFQVVYNIYTFMIISVITRYCYKLNCIIFLNLKGKLLLFLYAF